MAGSKPLMTKFGIRHILKGFWVTFVTHFAKKPTDLFFCNITLGLYEWPRAFEEGSYSHVLFNIPLINQFKRRRASIDGDYNLLKFNWQ